MADSSTQIQEDWGWIAPEETASSSEPKMPEMPAYRSARKMKRYEQDMKRFEQQQNFQRQQSQDARWQKDLERQSRLDELSSIREDRLGAQFDNDLAFRKNQEQETAASKAAGASSLRELSKIGDKDSLVEFMQKVPYEALSDPHFSKSLSYKEQAFDRAEAKRYQYTPQDQIKANIIAAGGDINPKDGKVYRNDPQLGNVEVGSLVDKDGRVDPASAAYIIRELGGNNAKPKDLATGDRSALRNAQVKINTSDAMLEEVDAKISGTDPGYGGEAERSALQKERLRIVQEQKEAVALMDVFKQERPDLFPKDDKKDDADKKDPPVVMDPERIKQLRKLMQGVK